MKLMVNCWLVFVADVQVRQVTGEDVVGTILPIFVSSPHALVAYEPAAAAAAAAAAVVVVDDDGDDDDDVEAAELS